MLKEEGQRREIRAATCRARSGPAISAFPIVGEKLYLNYNEDIRKKWRSDIPGYVRSADKKWPDVSRQTKVID